MKSLEWWIAQIQYQALADNYLILPPDWVEQMRLDGIVVIEPKEEE